MEFNENNQAVKNLPVEARREWAVAATVGGNEKAGWDWLKKAGWSKEGHKWVLAKSADPAGEKFQAPVRLAKAEKEGEDLFVTMVASGFGLDRQGDKMEKSAIDRMIATCKAGTVGMRESHNTTFPIAKSVDAFLDQNNEMQVKMKLEKAHPMSGYVFDRVANGEAVEQASVYGAVTKKDYVWEPTAKKMVKSIQDVALSFIDLTPPGESAYKGAGFVEAIAKQVSWAEEPKAPSPEGTGKGETMEELLKQMEAVADALEKAMAPDFKIESHMFGKDGVLKKDFKEKLDSARPSLTAEQTELLNKSVMRILNAAGIETIDADGEVPGVQADPMSKSKVVKKLAKALGIDKDELRKALGLKDETPAPAVVPGLDDLKKQLSTVTDLVSKLSKETAKGRPAVPGDAALLRKDAAAAGEAIPMEELTAMVKQVGEAAKDGMLTADGQANARMLVSNFTKRVAEMAIAGGAASTR